MKKLLIVLSFIGIALLLSSCLNIKPPIITFKEYQVDNISLASAKFNFIFDLENPNDIPINIKSISYRFYLENNEFVSGISKGFDLHAKESKEIVIPLEISYLGVLGSVAEVAKALIIGNKRLRYRLEGVLTAESLGATGTIPLKAEGELLLIN